MALFLPVTACAIRLDVQGGASAMDELKQELDRLLEELAEMGRRSAHCDSDSANLGLMTIARRGTKLAIAEVRSLIAQRINVEGNIADPKADCQNIIAKT